LSVRRREGRIVLLDIQAKIRKIPAVITHNDADRVEIWTRPQYLYGDEYSVSCLPPTEVADGQVKILLSGSLDEEMDELEDGEIVDEEEEREEEAGEVNETEENRTMDGEDGEFEEGEIVEEEQGEELYEDEEITDGESKDGDQIVPTRPGKLVPYPDSDSSDTIINLDNPV